MFSTIGRPARSSTGGDPSARLFPLFVVAGLAAAVFGFFWDWANRPPELTIVEVDMRARPSDP
jgi:hypothetical protein